MKNCGIAHCPICKSEQTRRLVDLESGNLDHSVLYPCIQIEACNKCGHIFNRLSQQGIRDLRRYYNDEYAPINMSASYKAGNWPGEASHDSDERYSRIFDLISPHIDSDSRVLDVGCAMGGFLNYLHEKGMTRISGVDMTESFVQFVRQNSKYQVKLGSAESIPFEDNSFDVLIIDQVVEHLVDPQMAIEEAKRVLVDGGILYLGVPNAIRYGELSSFGYYWFLMRDHVQHFDIEHLSLLATLKGFDLIESSGAGNLILSKELALPNLSAIFSSTGGKRRFTVSEKCFELTNEITRYISNSFENQERRRKTIDDLVVSKVPTYIWGVGPEFLYIYESAGLKHSNIAGLIDTNPYKQTACSVDGRTIGDKSILEMAPSNSALLICAIGYLRQIRDAVSEMNYPGQIRVI